MNNFVDIKTTLGKPQKTVVFSGPATKRGGGGEGTGNLETKNFCEACQAI